MIPYEAYFSELRARWPRTAAAQVPLVIWRDEITPENAHLANRHNDFFSLYIVRQGRGTHVIDGISYGVARGDVYAMGVGMTHHFTDVDGLITDTLHFSPSVFEEATLDALAETPGFQLLFVEEPLRRRETNGANGEGGRWLHLTPDAYAPVADMLEELRREWLAGTPSGTLLTQGLFLRLLVSLARRYAEVQAAQTHTTQASPVSREATVVAAVRYLDTHFAEPLRIEQVAASVFLSPDRFTKVFAAVMGRTPRDYLRHLRLERAKTLLTTTEDSIAQIGQDAGFSEASYFTRVFKAAVGLSPRRYRQRSA